MSVPTQSMTQILQNPAAEEERKRIQQLRAMAVLGAGMGTRPTQSIAEILSDQANRQEKLGFDTRNVEAEAQIRAGERGEMRDYRAQQQANWEAEQQRLKDKASEPNPLAVYRGEDSMKGGYNREMGDISTTLDATSKVKTLLPGALGRAPSSIEQQSLVVLLNKFLDPTSVVREGEFNRVVEGQGLAGRAENYKARLLEGKPLSAEMINDIGVMANLYERAAKARGQQISDRYRATATKRGFDPNAIIDTDRFPDAAADEDVPPPGAVRRKR